MKTILKWLASILGTALALALAFVLLPHVSELYNLVMPDPSAAAIRASAIISTELENSARLETLVVTEEGVLNEEYKIAANITVAHVSVQYVYTGSFGIDLAEVEVLTSGNELIFSIPEPILLADHLEPVTVDRNTYLMGNFDDEDYQQLLEDERIVCRERYLGGEYADQLWQATTAALTETIEQWISLADSDITVRYAQKAPLAPSAE